MIDFLKKTMILIIALILIFFLISMPDTIPDKKTDHLRVVAVNYLLTNRDHLSFMSQIKSMKADVVFISEYQADVELLFEKLNYKKSAAFEHPGTHGTALYISEEWQSNTKILYPDRFSPCTMPFAISNITGKGIGFRFLGVHLPPPLPQCDNKTDESYATIHEFIERYRMDSTFSIIAGDFNSFPFSSGIQELKEKGWVDTYDENRFFPGPTWSPVPILPAIARIDYIFTNQKNRISESYSISLKGSDHRMVVTDFSL